MPTKTSSEVERKGERDELDVVEIEDTDPAAYSVTTDPYTEEEGSSDLSLERCRSVRRVADVDQLVVAFPGFLVEDATWADDFDWTEVEQ